MKFGKRLRELVAIALMLLPLCVSAQPLDNRRVVENLSIMDRLSIRTNGTDWLAMIPNLGVEFDVSNKNWNRWAVNVNLRYRPGANTNYTAPVVYQLTEFKVEGRMYWRERQAQASGPMAYHEMPWDKLMSCRRMIPKHPRTVFYRGLYAAYDKYDFFLKSKGYKGNAVQFGATWGFVKNLYTFSNNNSIDMEIGISAGIAFWKNTKYTRVKQSQFVAGEGNYDYQDTQVNGWKLLKIPMINDLHAALVYRLGKYPVQKKYRWRYDVDMDYRARVDSTWLLNDRNRTLKFYRDSVYKVVARDFTLTYDSVIAVRHKEAQERIDKSAPKRMQYIKVDSEGKPVTKASKKANKNNATTKKED